MTTAAREITQPVEPQLPSGALNPAAVGWTRRRCTAPTVGGRRGAARKRWEYWALLTPTHIVGLTASSLDYAGVTRSTCSTGPPARRSPGASSRRSRRGHAGFPATLRARAGVGVSRRAGAVRRAGRTGPRSARSARAWRLDVGCAAARPRVARRGGAVGRPNVPVHRQGPGSAGGGTAAVDGRTTSARRVVRRARPRPRQRGRAARLELGSGAGLAVAGSRSSSAGGGPTAPGHRERPVPRRPAAQDRRRAGVVVDPGDWPRPWRDARHGRRTYLHPFHDRVSLTDLRVVRIQTHQCFGHWSGLGDRRRRLPAGLRRAPGSAEDVEQRW